jgi:hypothetical protein
MKHKGEKAALLLLTFGGVALFTAIALTVKSIAGR